MKAIISFLELNNMSDKLLQKLEADRRISVENRKRIQYEIHIRSIELPNDWKLRN